MKQKIGKRIKVFLIIFFAGLILLELHLRFFWGFGDSILMRADKDFEYIQKPDQNRYRFRNHVKINSFSMRSDEPDSSAYTILGLGDSVIYGGVLVDQDSLMTTLISEQMTAALGRKVQMLNIAAGSWGPDNCYAYLQRYGDFNAKILVLVVSSHDAYDDMDFRKVVDHDPGYESTQYKLAIWELIDRYLMPRIFPNSKKPQEIPGVKRKGEKFNSGFENIYRFTQNKGIPLIMYLHPDTVEIRKQEYNVMGREIMNFCHDYDIKCISGFGTLNRSDYRDVIHLKESGQRKMTEQLLPVIEKIAKKQLSVSHVE